MKSACASFHNSIILQALLPSGHQFKCLVLFRLSYPPQLILSVCRGFLTCLICQVTQCRPCHLCRDSAQCCQSCCAVCCVGCTPWAVIRGLWQAGGWEGTLLHRWIFPLLMTLGHGIEGDSDLWHMGTSAGQERVGQGAGQKKAEEVSGSKLLRPTPVLVRAPNPLPLSAFCPLPSAICHLSLPSAYLPSASDLALQTSPSSVLPHKPRRQNKQKSVCKFKRRWEVMADKLKQNLEVCWAGCQGWRWAQGCSQCKARVGVGELVACAWWCRERPEVLQACAQRASSLTDLYALMCLCRSCGNTMTPSSMQGQQLNTSYKYASDSVIIYTSIMLFSEK